MTRNVFKVMTKRSGGGLNSSSIKHRCDLFPNLGIGLYERTRVDCPAMEGERGGGANETGRFHLLSPEPVMRRDNELRVAKICLEELAELIAVSRIDRHDDVI